MMMMMMFALGALVQFLNYTNLVINIRAISHANVPLAVATDAIASILGYTLVRRIAEKENKPLMFGMALGGALASWFGIWLTRTLG